jgi:HEAT repeat protein
MVKRKRPVKDVAALLADLEVQATFVRRTAIIELVERGARETAGRLQGLLVDKEASIRACAAWALGELGEPGSAGTLAVCLKDMDVDVRRAAAQSLANMGQAASEPALQSASVDSDRWVAEWARRGLARLQNGVLRKRPKILRKSPAQDEGRA